MLRFSNRNQGFSFLEIILTIALVGAVITPVMVVQYNVLSFMTGSRDKIRTIFLLDALFPQVALEKKGEDATTFNFEKKYNDPAVTLYYEVLGLPEKSILGKMQHLHRTRTTSTPQSKEAGSQREISFLFIPPATEPEKAKAPAQAQGAA